MSTSGTGPHDNFRKKIEEKSKNLAYRIDDLTECEHEPISFCGAVQTFGLLFVVNIQSHLIEAVSDNVKDVLGLSSTEEVLGQPIGKVLDIDLTSAGDLDDFCNHISSEKMSVALRGFSSSYQLGNCFREGEHIVFEVEHQDAEQKNDATTLIKDLIFNLRDINSIEKCCLRVAESARKFSGYDRVMIYRFDDDWNGEVVAEAKLDDLESWQNLRYPASDIPQQARDLFFQNQTRIIADATAAAVPIVSQKLQVGDIDLSPSMLRAVSPFHLQYLENMGVRATLSVPIRVGNKLWGLVACHHYAGPRHPDRNNRSAFDLAATMLASRLAELVENRRMQVKNSTLVFTQSLLNDIAAGRDIADSFLESGSELLDLTGSASAYVKIGEREVFIGKPIRAETLEKILAQVREESSLAVWRSNCLKDSLKLSATDPDAAGAMAVPFSLGFSDVLIWFRPEEQLEVRWGGRPKVRKPTIGNHLDRLSPRGSFQEWRQKLDDQSRPWTESDQDCAQYFLFGFVQEIFVRAQSLSLAYKELERVAKAKDEFISTVSHELRTPLGVIIGWVDILRDYPQEFAEAKQAVEIIERNAKAQVALIDDLLDVQRIVSGKMRIDAVESVNLTTVISNVVESVHPAAQAKGINVRWHPLERVHIAGDPDRLRQIVWNLVSNALKFTPKGGEIKIRARLNSSAAEIEVSDSGLGIEPAQLNLIFERFMQANTASNRAGGLGLGLSIVKGLVELHGGQIRAFSEGLGKGSKFTVTLPVSALVQEPLIMPTAPSAIVRSEQMLGFRILVAEDQAESQLALKILCERNGAKVTVVSNGKDALKHMMTSDVDLILSDVGMPEMDGHEFMRAWRAEEARRGVKMTPAVALTAYASSKDRTLALQAGFMSHIPKPVDRAELMAVISSLNIVPKMSAGQQ